MDIKKLFEEQPTPESVALGKLKSVKLVKSNECISTVLPTITVYVWYLNEYPFYITSIENEYPHRYSKSLTLLEHFRRQTKNNFSMKELITIEVTEAGKATDEIEDLILNLASDLVTLGFLVFGPNGLPYKLIKESDLSTVTKYLPHLLNANMHGYINLITDLKAKAEHALSMAIKNKNYVSKYRGN